MSKISRRDLLRYSALGMSSLVVSTGVEAHGGYFFRKFFRPFVKFTHGVASGDPLSDRVIIWTRVEPRRSRIRSIPVVFQVATDPKFRRITNAGIARVNADTDFTLKIDVRNLDPETTYYYRFFSKGARSVVGKTKTLPATDADVSKVKLAVFSCSNYPTGYFNVYQDAVGIKDLDAVLHLGDYIYEYRTGEFGTENSVEIGRALPADNDVEIVTLEDYRKRYALYRTDPSLLELHQSAPFIVVPDDHEVTNDTYIDGAENHQPETEGDFSVRKANALKAYFEWMPIRPAAPGDNETLSRSFKWGNLVNLMMLDTRLIGRTRQLPGLADPMWYDADGSFNVPRFVGAISDPSRTMLGAEQLAWLQGEMTRSSATWQVLGQQVLMGRMEIPFEVLVGLGGDVSQTLGELAVIKARVLQGDPSVTPEERARVESVAPYNLDAWDGYQFEREVILGTATATAKNLVVLAGDTHNGWANNLLTAQTKTPAGVEFACSSVTSPGLEGFLNLDFPGAVGLEQGLNLLIDGLQYSNYFDRGYMVVTFTTEDAEAEWRYVDNILSPEYNMLESRKAKLKTLVGQNTLMPA